MAKPANVYWDSCVWLGYINRESNKFTAAKHIIERAKRGDVQIYTSAFTLAEVVSRKCDAEKREAAESTDDDFSELLSQDFVTVALVDWDTATKARELYRRFRGKGLKKPQDALHLATACMENVDEMHTFDYDDLLRLNGLAHKEDGSSLIIRRPSEPDVSDGFQENMFDGFPRH